MSNGRELVIAKISEVIICINFQLSIACFVFSLYPYKGDIVMILTE